MFVDSDESRIVGEAIDGIHEHGAVYQRGGKIVETRFVPFAACEKSGISKSEGAWQISEAKPPRVRALASESCEFSKLSKKNKTVGANVPDYLAAAVLSQKTWPFPVLGGIAEIPTLRPDGSLITEVGFDKATGIYLTPYTVDVRVPEHPTIDDAKAAVAVLIDPVCQIPFSSNAGRSVWISGILSIIARPAIDGPVPMHVIDASMRGAGKSKLVDMSSIITTGRPAPRMVYSESDEEMDKRISALGLAGDASVLIDNVIGEIGCASLDSALTSTSYRGRVLGKTEMTPYMPMKIVWWATGNGVIVKADLARRIIISRIEPLCAHPEERKDFKYQDLLWHTSQHRSSLLSAALTIIRAYFEAGCPPQNLPAMDFNAWSSTVRSAIVWAGLADPGETVKAARAADARADAFRLMIESWPVANGTNTTARDLVEVAAKASPTAINFDQKITEEDLGRYKLWRDALLEWCPPRAGESGLPSVDRFGRLLRSIKGNIISNEEGQFKIEPGKHTNRGLEWSKVKI